MWQPAHAGTTASTRKDHHMNYVLSLQSADISFQDEGGPLSGEPQCPAHGSQITIGCSTSSNYCDIGGMGEFFY